MAWPDSDESSNDTSVNQTQPPFGNYNPGPSESFLKNTKLQILEQSLNRPCF
jgi:hypothetical protein